MPISEVVALRTNGDKLVGTGYKQNSSTSAVITFSLDGSGGLEWYFSGLNPNDEIELPTQIIIGENEFYVTGFIKAGVENQWKTVKYSSISKDTSRIYAHGKPVCLKNELIIRFHPSVVDHSAIDNEDRYSEYGELTDYLLPDFASVLSDKLCGSLSPSISNLVECSDFKLLKIFKTLKSTDTIAVNRLGDTIDVPKFWATLILKIPDGLEIEVIQDTLEALFPDISFNHPNPLIGPTSIPNDNYYSFDQLSLHAGNGTPWGIDIDTAWDIEPSAGKSYVKVGVFDSGIDWLHEDFGYDGSNKNTSTISGGWDLPDGVSLKTLDSGDRGSTRHGTAVAGIIGANRNNGIGIAGIVGGDFLSSSLGSSLFSLAIYHDSFYLNPMNYVADAMVTSVLADTANQQYRYGLHVQNHSWRISNFGDLTKYLTDTNITLLSEALGFLSRMNVTTVAAIGNEGNSDPVYPAGFDDNWVICVGGTDVDGNYKTQKYFGDFAANYGNNIDIAAPSAWNMSYSLVGYGGYDKVQGTSFAAPHVSGVAALLMSYLNDSFPSSRNLAPEDIENILQITAYDVGITGYDSLTGYGRLNAGRAMQLIDTLSNDLAHFDLKRNTGTKSLVLYDSSVQIYLKERFSINSIDWIREGNYVADLYEVNITVNHILSAQDTIVYSWPRHSASNLFPRSADFELMPHYYVLLDSVNNSKAWLHGYTYKLYDSLNNVLGWFPIDSTLNNLNVAYSILSKDSSYQAPNSVKKIDVGKTDVYLYPNPCYQEQEQRLRIQSEKDMQYSVYIFNSNGQLLGLKFVDVLANIPAEIPLTLGNMSGVFFIEIRSAGERIFLKSVNIR